MSLVFFGLAIVCRAISELALHSKLRWSKGDDSFWGEDSWRRKYKRSEWDRFFVGSGWYYRIFNIPYKEAWPTSATFTVFLTDGPHFMQFLFHIFLSLGIWSATGYHWFDVAFWNWFVIWCGILAIHFVTYRLLAR